MASPRLAYCLARFLPAALQASCGAEWHSLVMVMVMVMVCVCVCICVGSFIHLHSIRCRGAVARARLRRTLLKSRDVIIFFVGVQQAKSNTKTNPLGGSYSTYMLNGCFSPLSVYSYVLYAAEDELQQPPLRLPPSNPQMERYFLASPLQPEETGQSMADLAISI